jgi:hypothetical protein
MYKENLIWIIGIISILAIIPLALASDTDTATVYVSVAAQTLVDISPNSVSWSDVAPGTSSSIVYNFTVENIGSNNISTVYAYTTYEQTNPFGTGAPTNYDAANFLLIQNNDTASGFYFANRVEYNDSNTWNLRYLKLPSSVDAVGRFRVAGNEYFWALDGNGTSADELCTNGTIYIGSTAHNDVNLGDVDLTDNSISWTGDADKDGILIDAPSEPAELANYAIYIDDACDFVALYKWARPGGNPWNVDDQSTKDQPLFSGTLYPGANFKIDLQVKVPFGVAAGSVKQGTLTIYAE